GSSGQPRVTSVPAALRIGYSTGFRRRSGQMYDVNGAPPIVTSTRRAASFTCSATLLASRLVPPPAPSRSSKGRATKGRAIAANAITITTKANDHNPRLAVRLLMGHPRIAASDDNLLLRIIERHPLTGVDRGDRHA